MVVAAGTLEEMAKGDCVCPSGEWEGRGGGGGGTWEPRTKKSVHSLNWRTCRHSTKSATRAAPAMQVGTPACKEGRSGRTRRRKTKRKEGKYKGKGERNVHAQVGEEQRAGTGHDGERVLEDTARACAGAGRREERRMVVRVVHSRGRANRHGEEETEGACVEIKR